MTVPPHNSASTRSATELAATTYRAHALELQRYLLRRVDNRHDADDLSQEVFARLLRVESAELIRNPAAYVLGIAAHVVREFRQRKQQQCVVFDSDVTTALTDAPHTVDSDTVTTPAEQIDMRNVINAALKQLPLNHKLALLLVKRDGLSYEETAAKLGLSVNTIERYLVEARARMRAILRET